MLEVKEDRWFGKLDDGSPKVKWMRRVYPRVDYTQAPWTVVMLRQPSQSIHSSREVQTFRRRFRIPYVFSWAPLLVGNTAEVVSSFATTNSTIVYFRINNYYIHQVQHIRWCTQQTVCSTHTHIRTVTYDLFVYILLLYSSLYLFEYCCFYLNSGTVHPDIVHRNRKCSLLSSTNNGLRIIW